MDNRGAIFERFGVRGNTEHGEWGDDRPLHRFVKATKGNSYISSCNVHAISLTCRIAKYDSHTSLYSRVLLQDPEWLPTFFTTLHPCFTFAIQTLLLLFLSSTQATTPLVT